MKIILAIFAIACTAAFLALREGDVPTPQVEPLPAHALISQAAVRPDDAKLASPQALTSAANSMQSPASNARAVAAGDDLLRAARERLDRYSSVTALIRYRIMMFDNELIGAGMYQQAGQGSERRYRLELKTQLGEKLTSLLHVCDGETLWTYRERPTGTEGTQLERLDLRRVRAAQGEASRLPPSSPVEELATGGLLKFLDGLQSSFRPLRAEAGRLGDMPMWAVELEWKPAVLATLLSAKHEQSHVQGTDLSKQAQIPERVMAYLGHEDLFPRRVEFRRRAPEEQAVGAGRQGGAGEFVPAVAVEFTDVRFNEPIDPRQFEYGAASAVDVTEAFLRSRGLPIVR
jgi:hypothetical protein